MIVSTLFERCVNATCMRSGSALLGNCLGTAGALFGNCLGTVWQLRGKHTPLNAMGPRLRDACRRPEMSERAGMPWDVFAIPHKNGNV
eukprot:2130956-Lingulodinium_polyedra.AAC.1